MRHKMVSDEHLTIKSNVVLSGYRIVPAITTKRTGPPDLDSFLRGRCCSSGQV